MGSCDLATERKSPKMPAIRKCRVFYSGLGSNIALYVQQICSIVVILIGMYMVTEGTMSVGALIACVMIGGRAIAPIAQVAKFDEPVSRRAFGHEDD